jgi:DNA-binding transcriptional ArsR family regulator
MVKHLRISLISLLCHQPAISEHPVVASNAVFRALSDPTRREIINLLREGALSSGQIAERFPSAWATISRHLGVLKEAGLITAERNGNSIIYEVNTTVLQELVQHLMDWAKPGGDDA